MIDWVKFFPSKVRVFRLGWQMREEFGDRALFVALENAERAASEGRRARHRFWSAVAVEIIHQFRRRSVIDHWMHMPHGYEVSFAAEK